MVHEAMMPSNYTSSGGGEGHSGWYGIWVFAIVIIFFALIMVWRRDDGHHKGNYDGAAMFAPLATAATVGSMNKAASHEIWDVERDQMREFANLRQQVDQASWTQTRDNDRYFYENRTATDKGFYDNGMLVQQTRYDTLLGFKDNEVQGLKNTAEIKKEIGELKAQMQNDKIAALTSKVNFFETVVGVRGFGSVPSHHGHAPVQSVNYYQQEVGAPGYACGYGY